MPHELDRIKQLAGLQQEAAVSLKGKESAIKAWYNKYSKYTGGNGDPLPFGLIKAYTESGIISDGYEQNELAKAEKALGKKEMDWEDKDWQKVYSMTPITQGMEKDLLAITGSKTVDEELLAKVYDVIEDMYPNYSDLLGKKESAVAEAPAANRDDLEKAYMLAVRHHEGSGDDEGTGDGNYSEDVADLLMDYYEKTGKKPDHEQIKRISNKINADEEHYADILNAENINGKVWLELAKKYYGITMKIKEPITYPESAEINKNTMPHELDRIKELAGLQQEAPASGDQALAKDLANHFMKKANEFKKSGDTGIEYEEMVDIAKAFQQGLDQGMEEINDLANFEFSAHPFGGKFSNNEGEPEDEVLAILNKHGYSFTEKSHPERPNRGLVTLIKKGAKESAVAEAPAGLTAQQKQGLAALVKKYAKRKTYGGGGLISGYLDYLAQTGIWTDAADEKEFDVALKKLGHEDLDAWEQDAEGEEFEQFLELAPITAQSQNDVEKVLGKGFENNTQLISAASDYVKSLPETEESAVQPEPVLNAVKETPVTSQVDEAIKKATAQLKSFSNFDGLKPYKPKKK